MTSIPKHTSRDRPWLRMVCWTVQTFVTFEGWRENPVKYCNPLPPETWKRSKKYKFWIMLWLRLQNNPSNSNSNFKFVNWFKSELGIQPHFTDRTQSPNKSATFKKQFWSIHRLQELESQYLEEFKRTKLRNSQNKKKPPQEPQDSKNHSKKAALFNAYHGCRKLT